MAIKLAELAVRYGCEVRGNPDTEVNRVGTLQGAAAGCIAFLANTGYRKYLGDTKASAVILSEKLANECPTDCLIADDPYLVYARVAADLYPQHEVKPGVHPSAVIGGNSTVPASCELAPGVVIGANVTLGENVSVGPNTVIGDYVSVGADTRFAANVSVYAHSVIGERCILHSGAVVGADGFGIAQSSQGWIKVPQLGRAVLGNDVELGALSSVDRGAIEDTLIGNGVKLDNLVQIGHNVVVGDHTVMASQAGVSGSTKVGARCVIGGKSGIAGHLDIADDVYLLGAAHVSKSITKPGMYSSVVTVEEVGVWRRIAARIKSLDKLAKRLAVVEKKVN